ncbi:hypothetical protein ON010_g6590 [Phytophthora cinnamomi]|nr:hypothetical protein ON010_g6590 [Phytophthora cinnamomi]
MDEFMIFETPIVSERPHLVSKLANHNHDNNSSSDASRIDDLDAGEVEVAGTKPALGRPRRRRTAVVTKTIVPVRHLQRADRPPRGDDSRPPRSCPKCSDLTHSIFRCAQVKDYEETKSTYLSKAGNKVGSSRSVGVAGLDPAGTRSTKHTLPCRVMDRAET